MPALLTTSSRGAHFSRARVTEGVGRPRRKVPELSVYFWIVKVLTTALGESISDYLVYAINPYVAVTIGAAGLAVALLVQFSVRRYIAWAYWFAVALAVVFVVWNACEGTLSIHSIYTRRRELFYWAAVLAAFALGTASGDLTAITMHLGYFASGVLFAGVFAVPALAYWRAAMNAIFAFWFAYIATRPLGASFADWMGKPTGAGGLGWGDGPVSLGLAILIVALVGYLATTRLDVNDEPVASTAPQ